MACLHPVYPYFAISHCNRPKQSIPVGLKFAKSQIHSSEGAFYSLWAEKSTATFEDDETVSNGIEKMDVNRAAL